MDADSEDDLQDIIENIDKAEVMSLFFPTFRRAVVIDTRSNEKEGPMVRIMPMAASPQERMRTIRRLRPGFPRVRNIILIPWLRYVDSLVELGVWERIVNRFVASGHSEVASACDSILQELRQLEKAELIAVVRGDNYQSIWSAGE